MEVGTQLSLVDDIPGQTSSVTASNTECQLRCLAVSNCAGWTRKPNGRCHLSSVKAAPARASNPDTASGSCLQSGTDICHGPSASDCSNGALGCANVYSNGTCVQSCPLFEAAGSDRQCQCTGFRSGTTDDCAPCHPECLSCFGPGPDKCLQCRTHRLGATCVNQCPTGFTPGLDGVCAPCPPECATVDAGRHSCALPGDHTQCGCHPGDPRKDCVKQKVCKHYDDAGDCRPTCPPARPFVVDCGSSLVPNLQICRGIADMICVGICPSQLPLYNDTRKTEGTAPTRPQVGPERRTVHLDWRLMLGITMGSPV